MKEDILEQLVEDWLIGQPGWFVKHNLKFRPHANDPDYISKKDSVHSDIDILAISGTSIGQSRVRAITCKSWQGGLNLKDVLPILEGEALYQERSASFVKREGWKYYRELVSPKWMRAFLDRIQVETGQRDLEYYIAVTSLKGTREQRVALEESQVIRRRFHNLGSQISLRILTLEEIMRDISERQSDKVTPALESTEVGRLVQVLHAAGFEMSKVAPPPKQRRRRNINDGGA